MSEIRPSLVPDFEHDERASDSFDDAPTLEYSTRLARAAQFFAWDGGLPLAVAVIPFALDALGGVFLAGLACIFVPLIAAFMRFEVGLAQIRTRVRNPPPIVRQVLLAAAVVVLLIFEIGVSAALTHGNAPIEVWYIAAGLYVIYLALIWAALRSTSGAAASR
jgi:hypothetical protein